MAITEDSFIEYFGKANARNARTAHQGRDDALSIVEALQLLQSN